MYNGSSTSESIVTVQLCIKKRSIDVGSMHCRNVVRCYNREREIERALLSQSVSLAVFVASF